MLSKTLFCAAAVAVAALAACSNEVETARTMVEIADDAAGQAEVFAEPVDVVTDRLYLGSSNLVTVSEEAPWHYGLFDLLEKSRVGIEVQTTDGSWSWVGFKVYHVAADGTLELLGVLEGEGWAGAIMRTRRGGSFVVESVGETLPSTLQVDITCMRADGRPCTPRTQPGGTCGTRGAGACDTGLFCELGEGCGRDDRGGTCERPVEMCPAVYGPVVCGCDGREYGTACQALAAGVNVDYVGSCPCDPLVFRTKVDGIADVTGRWTGTAATAGYDIVSSLTLHADGTFDYEQVWNPGCLRSDPPCRMASLLKVMSGTWENQGFAVQLVPSATDVPPELAQSFMIEQNCEGRVELSTVELGEDRRLGLDPCSKATCAEGEHCEVVQVQCVRAPCYPVAQCVVN